MSEKKVKVDELTIDGTVYVPKGSSLSSVEKIDGMEYVMIRTYSAGVHCGWLKEREGKEVTLLESIRIWKWDGAASISQLSQEGTNAPDGCKFGMALATPLILTESIEIITMTETAKQSIQNVTPWKK